MSVVAEEIGKVPLRNVRTWDAVLKPLGYVKVTGLSSVQTLSPPAGARAALIIVETQAVRFRDDGTDPTSTDGMPIAAGGWYWCTTDLSDVRFLELSASATVHVSYYGSA